MSDDGELQGRNLTQEVDAVKERMDEMAAAQTRIEEALLAMKDAFTMLTANRTTMGPSNVNTFGMPTSMGVGPYNHVNLENMHHQALGPFTIPIGMGYEPVDHHGVENQHNGGGGGGVPHMGYDIEEGHASVRKDKAREQWMEKMEEKIKAMQAPSNFGSLGL